jgi:diguanylate cyclase (GGDEF)-like protein
MDLLDEAIAEPGSVGNVAAIFIDLDNFKDLNDTFGHQCGDEILATVATRLRVTVEGRAMAGRLGGDEFLLVIRAAGAHAVAEQIVGDVTAALALPLGARLPVNVIGASLGTSVLEAGDTSRDLIRRADLAMYQAKGRAQACRSQTSAGGEIAA